MKNHTKGSAVTALIILASLIIVAALGWQFYKKPISLLPSKLPESQPMKVSFVCSDDTRFIAEFPNSNSVNIVVDGVVVRKLPLLTEDEGKRYEDAQVVYTFAGEEVAVATKATGVIVTCTQPTDSNTLPVNFGDQGEGGGIQPDVSQIISESIVGRWQGNDDATFIREFKDDNKFAEFQGTKVTATGSWKTFTKENAPHVSFSLEDAVYLEMNVTAGETKYFKVSKMTPEELELIAVDMGETLLLKRVQ